MSRDESDDPLPSPPSRTGASEKAKVRRAKAARTEGSKPGAAAARARRRAADDEEDASEPGDAEEGASGGTGDDEAGASAGEDGDDESAGEDGDESADENDAGENDDDGDGDGEDDSEDDESADESAGENEGAAGGSTLPFAARYPDDPALRELVRAFEAGDYGRVRREAPALAARTGDPNVARAARDLRARLDPDPLTLGIFVGTAVLLAFLAAWSYGHAH